MQVSVKLNQRNIFGISVVYNLKSLHYVLCLNLDMCNHMHMVYFEMFMFKKAIICTCNKKQSHLHAFQIGNYVTQISYIPEKKY